MIRVHVLIFNNDQCSNGDSMEDQPEKPMPKLRMMISEHVVTQFIMTTIIGSELSHKPNQLSTISILFMANAAIFVAMIVRTLDHSSSSYYDINLNEVQCIYLLSCPSYTMTNNLSKN